MTDYSNQSNSNTGTTQADPNTTVEPAAVSTPDMGQAPAQPVGGVNPMPTEPVAMGEPSQTAEPAGEPAPSAPADTAPVPATPVVGTEPTAPATETNPGPSGSDQGQNTGGGTPGL